MGNPTNSFEWTADQWNLVNRTITDEVSKVSVAGGFLPCFGPLQASVEVVRHQNLMFGEGEQTPLMVDDLNVLYFWTLSVMVSLKQQQMAQEQLGDALLAFRRAANLIARAEDAITLNGLPNGKPTQDQLRAARVPSQCRVTGHEASRGLFAEGQTRAAKEVFDTSVLPGSKEVVAVVNNADGEQLVQAIAKGIGCLETDGHLGPFVCIMGMGAYVMAHTPDKNSLVLPSDRIQPMLGTTILRSGTLDPNKVVLLALAGDAVDLVVATAPTAQFIMLTEEARHVFRVYERFALRVKEREAVCSFVLVTP